MKSAESSLSQNKIAVKGDRWIKCLSSSGSIRAVAITATDICNTLGKRHKLKGTGLIALSEAVLSGLILSSYCKSGEKVNLNIQGNGWTTQAIIDANSEGQVRGYVIERKDYIHKHSEVGPWGGGLLSVLRTKTEESQPYIGTVPLVTGYLAKDLTFYWSQSEQVPSAVGLFVFSDPSNPNSEKVTLAQGVLIQAMPDATEKDLEYIESQFIKLNALGASATEREGPKELLAYLLQSGFQILEEKPLEFSCHCSLDRVEKSLLLVGKTELTSMAEDPTTTVTCDFCSEDYVLSSKNILDLIERLKS